MSHRRLLVAIAIVVAGSSADANPTFVLTHDTFSSVGGSATSSTVELGYSAGQPLVGIAAAPPPSIYEESVGLWRSMLWKDATDVDDEEPTSRLPRVFDLEQNYPNPFNPTTTIRFAIPGSSTPLVPVTIRLYDISGRLLRVLLNEERPPGLHTITWDGTDEQGRRIGSGVYYYNLNAGAFQATRRLVLVK